MLHFAVSASFAVHISDGVLNGSWLGGGFIVAAALALFGAWRIRDEEIPHVALMTSAFFVSSLIHVRIPPTSVHLLLNGLVGVILGRRAALAIPVGLFLQAALIGHGGFTTLGINSCIMVLPALLAWQLFAGLQKLHWTGRALFRARNVTIGFLVGALAVLITALLDCFVLAWGGREDWHVLAQVVFIAHLPLAIIEGIVLGFTVGFLARVKPEMLPGLTPEKTECSVDALH